MMRSVIIIGAGPAGLTAARRLAEAGLSDVLVLERNPEAGGLPRFCGHMGWGIFDFHRIWTGPRYARELVLAATSAGAEIRTNVTVLRIAQRGQVEISGPDGLETLQGRAILLATGIRETPRGPRFVSGARPWGVTTTGALQEMVYAGGMRPFRSPVIVGTELISFSALLTSRHAGIHPVAMIEEGSRVIARHPAGLVAKYFFHVPVLTRTRVVSVEGQERVESVVIERGGTRDRLECDGVVFTGRFQPECNFARESGIVIDGRTGGPAIDNFYRCSQPEVFAAGNILRPVEHSGFAANEGGAAAASIIRALNGHLPSPDLAVSVEAGEGIRYIVPQRALPGAGQIHLHARAERATSGHLCLRFGQNTMSNRRLRVLPEQRITTTVTDDVLQPFTQGSGYEGGEMITLSLQSSELTPNVRTNFVRARPGVADPKVGSQ